MTQEIAGQQQQSEKMTEATDTAKKDGWIAWLGKGKLCEKWPNFDEKQGGVTAPLKWRVLQDQEHLGGHSSDNI